MKRGSINITENSCRITYYWNYKLQNQQYAHLNWGKRCRYSKTNLTNFTDNVMAEHGRIYKFMKLTKLTIENT